MSDVSNLSGYENGRYFGRAWALLTQQKGWWKPVLICAVAFLVPIAGPLAVGGYGLEWARRIAWGSTEGPSRKVKVGELIRSGWRGFAATVGWAILVVIVGQLLDNIPGVGGLLSFAWDVFGIFLEMLILVASVRATIYQSFIAGYRPKTLWQMGANDPWGLVRIWLIRLVAIIAVTLVSLFILIPALFEMAPYLYDLIDYAYSMSYYMTEAQTVELAFEVLSYVVGSLASAFIAILVVCLVVGSFMNLIVNCCIGLWLRQFNVAAWGRDEDPLPEGVLKQGGEKPEDPGVGAMPVRPAENGGQPVETPTAAEPVAAAAEPVEPAEPVAPVAPVEAPAAAEPVAVPMPAVQAEETTDEAPAASGPAEAAGESAVADGAEAVTSVADVEAAPLDASDPSAPVNLQEGSEPPIPGKSDCGDQGKDDDGDVRIVAVEPIAVAPIDVLGAEPADEPPAE